MKNFFIYLILLFTYSGCANSPELETGEIKTMEILKVALNQNKDQKIFPDARDLITRDQIDAAGIPIIFVELETGQNGTLTPYPGYGIGQTWLGADGATLTFNQGVLIASRGLGDDVMGGDSDIPDWDEIKDFRTYKKELNYLSGNNKIYQQVFDCKINKKREHQILKIWDIQYMVHEYNEECSNSKLKITNVYYVENSRIVRKSLQYHSESLGYIITERLER